MIVDGKALAAKLRASLKAEISDLGGRRPALAFVLIGEDSASQTYVRMKKKACDEVGITSISVDLPADVTEEVLLDKIQELNGDPKVDGLIIQQPLPSHISVKRVTEATDPQKDVDGFHPINMGKMLLGETDGFFSCTPYGIVTLLRMSQIETEGRHVVIVGRSNIVGKPLAALLMQQDCNATVTLAHSRTRDLKTLTRSADILIAAVGQPHFITKEMVKEGAVVIDVGINHQEGKIVGDVDFASVSEIASHITPVPGGVGPMTIAMLLCNTLKSYSSRS